MEKKDLGISVDRISGIVILLIGIVIIWQASLVKLGSLRYPGPGLYPLLLGLVIVFLSVFLIIPRATKERWGAPFDKGNMKRVAGVYAIMLLYLSILEFTGFIPASFILVFLLFAVIGKRGLKAALMGAFTVTVLAYLLFGLALKGQLPKGFLGI